MNFGQKQICATIWIGVAMSLAVPVRALTLARDGQPAVTVVYAAEATAAERMAANEVVDYLHRITGASFQLQAEGKTLPNGSRLFVGPTTFARNHGLTADKLGPEEWIIRTVDQDLVIIGGRPRGTVYGVYHFLEDVLGVHWWNPFEESVPHRRSLRIGPLNLQGRPVIQYRDIYMLYGQDAGRFAARNRLNRDGDSRIAARYGGCRDYGPPYHVHTFNLYFPPKEFFPQHPEWYSLVGGKRLGEGSQLCLTQPNLRKAFLAKLLSFIGTSWASAKADGAPPPLVFSVSQNDCQNPCQCGNCQAIAKAEESECGPLLDFVNYLADGIKDRYPEVYLDTLAYQYTQKAPKTIRPRDNVIVRLCDTESDPTQPITSVANQAFREQVNRWARIARNLRIWDYAVTYASPVGMPMPTAQTYGPDYRYYVEHHVEGVFTELEFEILADMRDFKIWMMMKQLEDPGADSGKLMRTFTDGFYGRGGKCIRQYLADLEKEATARRTRCDWNSTPLSLTYLNLGFINHAQRLFDQAEKAVGKDAVLLRRVRHARLPLDRATVVVHGRLTSDWLVLGKPAGQAPPDREVVSQRVLNTWLTEAKMRLPESALETEKQHAERELSRYATVPTSVALPEKFRALPKGSVHDYLATMTRNWADVVKVVKDPEAESGIANRLDLTASDVEDPEKYAMPMPWGIYGTVDKKHVGGNAIKPEDVPGPGYHWYKMGSFPMAPGYYVYFFWSRIIQADVERAFDPARPDQEFEVWARIKFEGPRFHHSRPGEKDAIYVERLVLVKTQH
jgi:RNA polymerase subunit RPABC4/transcription elongation factor Spt4